MIYLFVLRCSSLAIYFLFMLSSRSREKQVARAVEF